MLEHDTPTHARDKAKKLHWDIEPTKEYNAAGMVIFAELRRWNIQARSQRIAEHAKAPKKRRRW